MLILQPAKLSTPATAAFGFVVQVRTAPDVPVPVVIVSVTLATLVVTVFPNASWTVTFGCVDHAVLYTPPLGCWVNASRAALPAVTLKVLLVALVSPELDATKV